MPSDALRLDAAAVALVTAFTEAGKPIAAVCHASWTLIEAGVVGGKTLTSWPSLATDLRNAGAADWVDQEVFVCPANGWTLVSSRNPDDLPAFSAALVEAFGLA
jgi:protease I